MLKFIQDVLTLLVTPPGMLLYHLAIVVSIMAGLQAALLNRNNGRFPTRLVGGLSVLLIAQVALFIFGGLQWQNNLPPHSILPILDRAVTLTCLVWLIWLWTAPEASTPGDFTHGTLNLVVVLMLVSSLFIWRQAPLDMAFNAGWLDYAWQILSGVIALTGLVAIAILRPPRWGVGATSMILFMLGSVAHLLWKDTTSDLPALVRLAQLLIYPLLPVLAFRERPPVPTAAQPAVEKPANSEKDPNITPRALNSWLMALGAAGEDRAVAVTRAISHTIPADLCFVVEPPDNEGVITLSGGYDLLQDETIPATRIHQDKLPGMLNAIMRGQPLMLPPQAEESDDQATLAEHLGMEHCGSLLFIPNNTGASPVAGILL
ncbi:MAG: hypothetical protein HPY76_13915, partial [Anaerolineae bacterium]|nr:hypothetical protein [Anaerolineae bacterium]